MSFAQNQNADAAKNSTTSAGAVAVKITNNANILQIGISEKLGLVIQSLAMLCSALVIALIRQWELALVTTTMLVAMMIVYGIVVPLDMRKENIITASLNTAAGLAEEAFNSIRTVVSSTAEARLFARYDSHLMKAQSLGMRKGPLTGIIFATAFVFVYCGYSLCFWYGIRMVSQGRFDSQASGVGTVITVFFSIIFVLMALGVLAPNLSAITKAAGVANEVWEIVDRSLQGNLDAPDSSAHKTGKEKPYITDQYDRILGRIEFRHVTFAYPSRPTMPVLNDVSCIFEARKTTALVGSSGSGKSTVVALLERWYDLEPAGHGQILLDGQTFLREEQGGIDRRWVRSQIGLVAQEPFLFNDTIYQNVIYGMIGSQWELRPEADKKQKVRELCVEVNAHEFIQHLPQGYETVVGQQGIQLSGGTTTLLQILFLSMTHFL
jgi:ATP-binding cassette, subfamily B (MDR/TAP), member 1